LNSQGDIAISVLSQVSRRRSILQEWKHRESLW
jgi:hypothetical protein